MKARNINEDLEKLSQAFFKHLQLDDSCEFGSIGLDCKRPFGNSDVERDILEIIGVQPNPDLDDYTYTNSELNYARKLYFEKLIPYLQAKYLIKN